jgi:predicted membrane protein
MSYLKILALLNLAVFLIFMFVSRGGDKNKLFIKYIIFSYPLLAIYIIPVMSGFELLTYIFLICFYKRKFTAFRDGFIYTVLAVALILFIGIGIFLGEEGIAIENITEFLAVFPIFAFAKILIDECLEDRRFFYTVIYCLKVMLVFSFVFLCCQFVLGVSFTLSRTQNSNIVLSDAIRYPSFLSDPQIFSQYLAAMSFLCLIKDEKDERLPTYNYVLVVLSIMGILAAGGRAGLLGWALGLSLVILFSNASYRFGMLLTVGVLYLIAMNFQDSFSIFKRGGDMAETYDFRHSIWEEAWDIFLDQPLFGIGMGNYSNYVALHNPDQFWLMDNEYVYFDHPESGYLKYLTELGITGFVCIFSLILIPLGRAFFFFLRVRDNSLILMIAAVLSWMVGFYSTFSFGDVRIKILIVVILCLIITSKQRITEEQAEEEEEEPDLENSALAYAE